MMRGAPGFACCGLHYGCATHKRVAAATQCTATLPLAHDAETRDSCCRYLISQGCDVDCQTTDGSSIVWVAANNGSVK
jgi:hypothetical protein